MVNKNQHQLELQKDKIDLYSLQETLTSETVVACQELPRLRQTVILWNLPADDIVIVAEDEKDTFFSGLSLGTAIWSYL